MRLAILISGRGSNMQALLHAKSEGALPHADFVCVVSNRPDAGGLATAKQYGVPTLVHASRDYKGRREEYDRALLGGLEPYRLDGLVLAGFMRVLSPEVIRRYENAIVNIHPSLLPSFPGLEAQRQAVERGVRVSGCTVHFVDEGVDSGPIIVQRAVPVHQDDDAGALAARIIVEEHKAIVEAVDLWTSRRLCVHERRVTIEPNGEAGT